MNTSDRPTTTSAYAPEAIVKLTSLYDEALVELQNIRDGVATLGFTSERAKEYAHHGILRRVGLILRCVQKIFEIFPPDRTDHFKQEERSDLNIYLHAFLLNVYGVLDNVAWVVVLKATGSEPRNRRKISLYSPAVQKHLSQSVQDDLARVETWHKNYLKLFRDALAHRIPAYVPPKRLDEFEAKRAGEIDAEILEAIGHHQFEKVDALTEEDHELGSLLPIFVHSFGDPDRSPSIFLHNQILVDAKTIAAIVRAVLLSGAQ